MAKLRRVRYKLETFTHPHDGAHLGQRQRQLFAVGLFGTQSGAPPVTCNLAPRNVAAKNHSLATCYGPGAKDADVRTSSGEIQDIFLDGMDHGHLIGKQLGGSDFPLNLAPMGSSDNRGGNWAEIERSIKGASHALMAVCLTYNDFDDGRIPVSVAAAACELSQYQFESLDASGALDLLINGVDGALCSATTGTAVQQALVQMLNAWSMQVVTANPLIYGQLMPPPRPKVPNLYLTASGIQSGMYYRPLYFKVNRDRLTSYMIDGGPSGWRVENDHRFAYHPGNYTHPTTGHSWWTAGYGLAPADFRPYALLDWLALEGELHKVFEHPTLTADDFDIAWVGNKEKTYPPHFVAAILMMNRIKFFHEARGQDLYVSDYGKSDQGGLREGVTLCPQIDHIVPRNAPSGYHTGLTVFSNAAVASASYNNWKKDKLLYDPVIVGTETHSKSAANI
ncbi:DNA/RNA non-specific endonuclease [Novispirillum sp. DQ9]|uniref:DNA/RNA non-specific endonuclease n=1 Tax=Novispirillum sp. DQ9 TaxID=3398612 RepID=UPI003C7E6812